MRMGARGLAITCVTLLVSLALGCDETPPASLQASVEIVESDGTCASEYSPGASCTVTRSLSITVQEVGGRDVHLELVSGVLWDTRGMQNMHAEPAALSATDIRNAVGSSVVPAHRQLVVPYDLAVTLIRPFILGPVKVMVHVRGRDGGDNVIEADGEAF
jgi:hypothetical protein